MADGTDARERPAPRSPAYRAIAEELRSHILRSEDDPVRLPTEAELARTHQVSRQTVRRAYQELVADGMVDRVRGRGSFARRSGSQYLRQFGTVEDLMSLSVDTEMEVLSGLRREVQIEAAGRLRLDTDAVSTLTFRRLHAGVPFCATEVYLPSDVGALLVGHPALEVGARSPRTIIGLLDERLAEPIGGADQTITVALADEAVAAQLDHEVGAPMLRIDRIYRSVSGAPVELAVTRYVPSLYSYRTSLRRARA